MTTSSFAARPLLSSGAAFSEPVFYSISNCQNGLRRVSFGNVLIKQVVEELRREFPTLRTFATLSPLPGLRRWLADAVMHPAKGLLTDAQIQAVSDPGENGTRHLRDAPPPVDVLQTRTAQYLAMARTQTGQVIDPVARFHLGNGAR